MKKPSPQEFARLEEQAMLITSEIFNSLNQYTHDSSISKFFLTDYIAQMCYTVAGGFASSLYTPPLEPEEVKDTTIISFIYALMTYGFNIYLKERSLTTNAAPYTLPQDPRIIKKIQRRTLLHISRGKLLSTPLADKIIKILTNNIKNQTKIEELSLSGHRLNKRKFFDYCKLSMCWGYNFARGLLSV